MHIGTRPSLLPLRLSQRLGEGGVFGEIECLLEVFLRDPRHLPVGVQDVSAIPEALRSSEAEIGLIAVPAKGAQWVAGLLAENGVRAILNFAPTTLWPGQPVVVSNVDLAIELEKLCYYLMPPKAETPGSNHAAV